MTLTLRYAAQSDRGLIRDGNQDSVYAGPRLLAVADGMGGMAAGDVASNIVIGAMAPLDEDVPGDALVDALRNAVGVANVTKFALPAGQAPAYVTPSEAGAGFAELARFLVAAR